MPRFTTFNLRALRAARALCAGLFICITLLACQGAEAQMVPGLPGNSAVPEVAVLADSFGRETPRGLIKALLATLAGTGKAAPIDLMDLPKSTRAFQEARARTYFADLRTALDRSGQLEDGWEASDRPEGRHGDGLAEDQERIGVITAGLVKLEILARRVPAGEGAGQVWLISYESLRAISEAVKMLSVSPVDRITPGIFSGVEIGGIPIFHVVYTLGVTLLLLVCAKVFVWMLVSSLSRIFVSLRGGWGIAVLIVLRPMIVTLLMGMAIEPMLAFSGVSVVLRGMLAPVVHIAMVLAMTVILVRFADRLSHAAIARARELGHTGSISFLALARRAFKLAIVFGAILVALNAVGVDLTAGLAALGIGGIAVALGSQKTIGDFVGSLSVVADRVVKIGDVCRFGTVIGTVEDIGIRSTRIRTLERTVLTIPNGMFSSTEVENFSDRDMFRFYHLMALSTPPSASVLSDCVADLRRLVLGHEACEADASRVRLASFAQGLPNVEFVAYFKAADMPAFTAIQEEVLLGVMEVIERHGLQVGVPTQVMRLSQGVGANPVPFGDPR